MSVVLQLGGTFSKHFINCFFDLDITLEMREQLLKYVTEDWN